MDVAKREAMTNAKMTIILVYRIDKGEDHGGKGEVKEDKGSPKSSKEGAKTRIRPTTAK